MSSSLPVAPTPTDTTTRIMEEAGPSSSHKRQNSSSQISPIGLQPKRARTEKSRNPVGQVSDLAPRRSENFWINDRNVVVQIQETQFRVNSALLTRGSAHFAQLLNRDGNPSEAHVSVDGCELYQVEGDPQAFEGLLALLYDGLTACSAAQTFDFSRISQILRLATSLDFLKVRSWAIEQLTKAYPTGLHEFDWDWACSSRLLASQRIHLARDCDVPILLKTAFYHLVNRGGLEMNCFAKVDGSDESSGTGRENESVQADASTNCVANGDRVQKKSISNADIHLAVRLLEKFSQHWIKFALPPQDISGCSQMPPRPPCRRIFAENWTAEVHDTNIYRYGFHDPFGSLRDLQDIDWQSFGVCRKCAKSQREKWANEQETIWRKMDKWLNLDKNPEPVQ